MIKRLSQKDKAAVRHLWEETFKEDGPHFVDHYFDVYKSMEDVIGDVEGDELRCMLHLNPYQVMWQGKLYDTHYVVGVATHEAHRRKGYMRKMLQWVLRDRYEDGEVFTLLMPIDSRYYDQFGFGFIQDVALYRFYYKTLNRDNREVPHKVIQKDEGASLLGLYNGYKRGFDLNHNRGMRSFNVLLSEVASEEGHVILVPDGYVIYYNIGSHVFVREAVYVSSEGLFNILDYMGSVAGDQKIEWQMPINNPLKHLIPHLEGNERLIKPFMMVRVVNVKQCLEDMALIIGDCTIKVTDNQLLENNATYELKGGCVSLTKEKPDVTIDVESLAQWLFGYETLEVLAFTRTTVILHSDRIYYPEQLIHNYFNEFV